MNNYQQIRAIKRYARSMHIALEAAAMDWVTHGLAKRWRDGQSDK